MFERPRVLRDLGPWTNQAHISAEHVIELRKFIELEFAYESTNRCHSQVAIHREFLAWFVAAVFGHAAKFIDPKQTPAQPHSIL